MMKKGEMGLDKEKVFNIKAKVYRDDSIHDGFAAYLAPSLTRTGTAKILLNIETTFHACAIEDISPKEFLVESIMHEVGHAVEEFLSLEFDEGRIELIIEKYREKYGKEIQPDRHNKKKGRKT